MGKLAGARVLTALLPHANHKAPAVRQSVSWHVERCCLNADAKTFSGSPPATLLLEKTFMALVPLLEEGQQDTRAMAKRALCHLRAAAPANEWERVVKQLPDAKARVARRRGGEGPAAPADARLGLGLDAEEDARVVARGTPGAAASASWCTPASSCRSARSEGAGPAEAARVWTASKTGDPVLYPRDPGDPRDPDPQSATPPRPPRLTPRRCASSTTSLRPWRPA